MTMSGREPTVTFTVPESPAAVAVTVASRVGDSVTCASPEDDVFATVLDRLPLSVLKDTLTPLRGLPPVSVTLAEIVERPPEVI